MAWMFTFVVLILQLTGQLAFAVQPLVLVRRGLQTPKRRLPPQRDNKNQIFKLTKKANTQDVASSNKTIKEQKEPKKPIRFRPNSCVDYLRRGISLSGRYKLYDQTGKTYAAYCDMKSELDTAWTMGMSWTPVNRRLSAFFKIPFKYNSPQNEHALNWDLYRLSLARMRFQQTHSTHWRATCSYPSHGIDFRDYLRGNFKDFNIFDFVGERQCKKVEYDNIRGHVGTDLTAPFWQKLNTWTLHTDSTHTHCQLKTVKFGAASSEDNFGWYGGGISTKFRCTQGDQSTTQWWFGAHL